MKTVHALESRKKTSTPRGQPVGRGQGWACSFLTSVLHLGEHTGFQPSPCCLPSQLPQASPAAGWSSPASVPHILQRFPREPEPLIPRGANRGPGISRSSAGSGQGPQGLWATQHRSASLALPSSSLGAHRSQHISGWMLPRANTRVRFRGQRGVARTCFLSTGGQTHGLYRPDVPHGPPSWRCTCAFLQPPHPDQWPQGPMFWTPHSEHVTNGGEGTVETSQGDGVQHPAGARSQGLRAGFGLSADVTKATYGGNQFVFVSSYYSPGPAGHPLSAVSREKSAGTGPVRWGCSHQRWGACRPWKTQALV